MSLVPTVSTKAAGGNIVATATIANAAPAGTIVAMQLQWNPRISAAFEIIIPTAESWMLTDLYYNSTIDAGTDVDSQIEIKKDNDRLLDTSKSANSIVVTSQQRPNGLNGNLVFEGGSHMTMNAITSVVAGAQRNLRAITPYEKQG